MRTRRYQPIKAYAWVRMTCISSVSWIEGHHDKGGSIPVKLFTSSIALLTLAFPAGAAWANADVKGAEDITVTAGRAITATKIDTPLVETPQAVSVVDDTVFRDRGARNLQEPMRYSAGVTGGAYGLDTRNDASKLEEQTTDIQLTMRISSAKL